MPATGCATRRSPGPSCWPTAATLAIRITPDKAAGTLTIADNGIGMDRQELIDNLGTVARSGTRAFISKLAEAKDGAGPDRPVRRRVLFGLHGGRPHRGDEPPRRIVRGVGLDLDRRRGLRDRAGERGAGGARDARHRDRAAPEGRREEISRAARNPPRGLDLFGPHPVSDRARRSGATSPRRSIRRARCGSGRNPN